MSPVSADADPRRDRIVASVPPEMLTALVKTYKNYKLESLTKGQEVLVDEVFRLADDTAIQTLYEEYPAPDNFSVWFYGGDGAGSGAVLRAVQAQATDALRKGIRPNITENPTLYRIEDGAGSSALRFAAQDSIHHVITGLGERSDIPAINLYTSVVLHGNGTLIVFGPYVSSKASAVAAETDSFLRLGRHLACLKPKRGAGREFYDALKAVLGAILIETKRFDPSGDYKTVALESRQMHPDLELVPSFRKQYLHADSLYDVLQFACKNRLGIKETTHVKFGRPHGRFGFRPHTSLSVIRYFEKKLRELLH